MTNSPFTTIILIALMVVAFYFLILRPQKKRQQAQQKTMNELTPGTRVLLGSGLFGTITWVGAKQALIEVGPGVELTVLKQAIARVVTPGDEYSEPIDVVDEPDELDDQIEPDREITGSTAVSSDLSSDRPLDRPLDHSGETTRPLSGDDPADDAVSGDRNRNSEPTSTKE